MGRDVPEAKKYIYLHNSNNSIMYVTPERSVTYKVVFRLVGVVACFDAPGRSLLSDGPPLVSPLFVQFNASPVRLRPCRVSPTHNLTSRRARRFALAALAYHRNPSISFHTHTYTRGVFLCTKLKKTKNERHLSFSFLATNNSCLFSCCSPA